MRRNVIYWVSTALLAGGALLSAAIYLLGGQEIVDAFDHIGYPQHLRVGLGLAKLLGALSLLVPRFLWLKEWAYAGFTFTWISAFVAHRAADDIPEAFIPLVLLALLVVSYGTRPDELRLVAPPRPPVRALRSAESEEEHRS